MRPSLLPNSQRHTFSLASLRLMFGLVIGMMSTTLIGFIIGVFLILWPLFAVLVLQLLILMGCFYPTLKYSMNSCPRAPLIATLILLASCIISLVGSILSRTLFIPYLSLSISAFLLSCVGYILLIVHVVQLIHHLLNQRKRKQEEEDRKKQDVENQKILRHFPTYREPSPNEMINEAILPPISVSSTGSDINALPQHLDPSQLPESNDLHSDSSFAGNQPLLTNQSPIFQQPTFQMPHLSQDSTQPINEIDSDPPLIISDALPVNPLPIVPYTHNERSTTYPEPDHTTPKKSRIRLGQENTSTGKAPTTPNDGDLSTKYTSQQPLVLSSAFRGSQKVLVRPDSADPNRPPDTRQEIHLDTIPVLMNSDVILAHYSVEPDSSDEQTRPHASRDQPNLQLTFESPSQRNVSSSVLFVRTESFHEVPRPRIGPKRQNQTSRESSPTIPRSEQVVTPKNGSYGFGLIPLGANTPSSPHSHSSEIFPSSSSTNNLIKTVPSHRTVESAYTDVVSESDSDSCTSERNAKTRPTSPKEVQSIKVDNPPISTSPSQMNRISSAFSLFKRQNEAEQSLSKIPSSSHIVPSTTQPTLLPRNSSFVNPSLIKSPSAHLIAVPSHTDLILHRTSSHLHASFHTVPVLPTSLPPNVIQGLVTDSSDDESGDEGNLRSPGPSSFSPTQLTLPISPNLRHFLADRPGSALSACNALIDEEEDGAGFFPPLSQTHSRNGSSVPPQASFLSSAESLDVPPRLPVEKKLAGEESEDEGKMSPVIVLPS
ncbi:hypothetical protein BLNAU_4101 [Blattamonas nauphoetae]|uniref:Uncharacterized protein n=1 Tax=Blattamonas nauphoetae TaxID=2049346 RepID=A0ABQ9YBC4_9EUKA|nr:hypothetical protein BLNAU_4101 [Blattamonas nauphoetae]